ncbi:MAG: IS21 family transposase [Nitrospirota bacterium]
MKEKRWIMYCKIQTLKSEGFSQRKVAKMMGYSRKAVRRYWDMSPDEYDERILENAKKSSLEQHREQILMWLREYKEVSAAQIFDWLQEKYEVAISESSVRRYVSKLRKEYDIKSDLSEREYQSIPDPPMGYQMQIDIGIVSVENAITRKYQKLYCIGFVLSNSRYKYGVWYDYPPTASNMVNAIKACFEWMGGKPKELVFDQDRLIAVSENYGDIIYTKEFEAFRQNEKLKIYLCRGADPESKGRVEAVVKFFKNNFARYRPFSELWHWEEEFELWLSRCGNGKKHSITKKIPAEVFEVEREYLTPISYENNNILNENILTRAVRKDNTIFYEGNRYSVPLGTYSNHKEVQLEIKENELWIYDVFRDVLLAKHNISVEKGSLIQNRHHLRNTEEKVLELKNKLFDKLIEKAAAREKAEMFLDGIKQEKPRYARDQYKIIEQVIVDLNNEILSAALEFCTENKLYSAVDFRDAVAHFKKIIKEENISKDINDNTPPLNNIRHLNTVNVSKRELAEYTKKLGGGNSRCLN